MAAGLRAVYFWQFSRTPFARTLFLDSRVYDEWARQIAAGDFLHPHAPLFLEPGYAYLLAAIRLVGGATGAVWIIQGVLGTGTVLLSALIASKIGSRSSALITGIVAAAYLPLIYFEGLVLKTTCEVFLGTAMIFGLLHLLEMPAVRKAALLGGIAFFAVLFRSSLLPVTLYVVTVLALSWRGQLKGARLRFVGIVAAGPVLALGLLLARNITAGGESIALPYNSGINFYIGNCAACNGADPGYPFGRALPETEEADSRKEAERRAGHALTAAQSSRFWWRAAWGEILSSPARWMRLLAVKSLLYWNHYELTDNISIYFLRGFVPLLRWPLPGFWLAGVLGIAGICLALKDRTRAGLVIAGYIILQMVLVVGFHVAERYRLVAVPAMLALGIPRIFGALRPGGTRLPAIAAIIAGVFVVALPDPVHPDGQDLSNHQTMLASVQPGSTSQGASLDLLRRGVVESPGSADAHYNLAVVLDRTGDLPAAEREATEALRLKPELAEAHHLRAQVLAKAGKHAASAQDYEAAARLGFRQGPCLEAAAAQYGRAGNFKEAERCANEALAIDPASALAWDLLGTARYQLKDMTGARQAWEKSLALQPDNPRVRGVLERMPR